MSKPRLKIYGERNTGTNYLEKLIKLNLDVEVLPGVVPDSVNINRELSPLQKETLRDRYFNENFQATIGWKHAYVDPMQLEEYVPGDEGEILFITLTKNPYSWLLSLHKNPYHQYSPRIEKFESFLSVPWKPVGRENLTRVLKDPMALWNIKNSSYIDLQKKYSTFNLKYEELIADPEIVVMAICEFFGLRPNGGEFKNIEPSTKEKEKNFSYYREYYLNERWKGMLSKRAIKIINSRLDRFVLEYFQYKAIIN